MDGLTKKELQDLIYKKSGVTVPARFTKAQLITMLSKPAVKPRTDIPKAVQPRAVPVKFNMNTFKRRLSTEKNLNKSIEMVSKLKKLFLVNESISNANYHNAVGKIPIGNSTLNGVNLNTLFNMNSNKLRTLAGLKVFDTIRAKSKNSLIKLIKTGGVTRITGHGGSSINNRLAYTNKSECKSGRMQIKGTCWFQSILNGWLLSYPARRLLQKGLEMFKKSNNMKKWTAIDACPLHLSGAYFWSYIEYKLKEDYTDVNFHKNVLKGTQFTNDRLINNLQLAQNKENKGQSGANPWGESVKFLDKVFPGQWGYITPLKPIVLGYYKDLKKMKADPLMTRSHVSITAMNRDPVTNKVEGHAICGYRCKTGKLMIYDSNNLRSFQFDWLHDDPRDYFKNTYDFNNIYDVFYVVTYIRKTIDIPKLFGKK